MSDSEKNFALRQGHGIASEDGYFEARPQIDSMDRRKVFGAGFERGWEAALAAAPAQERIQALELEVRQLTERAAALRKGLELAIKQNSHDMLMTGEELRQCEAALAAQQPAPSAAPDDQMIAEYGRKASRMMARDLTRFDAACEVDKYLREEGAPGYYRHRMSIILFGNVEGTEASRAPENEAPQPSPTPQADSQPAQVLVYPPLPEPFIGVQNQPWGGHAEVIRSAIGEDGVIPCFTAGQMVAYADATHAARAQADSVLEDAYMLLQDVAACFTRDDDLPDNLLPRIDAALKARKQGDV